MKYELKRKFNIFNIRRSAFNVQCSAFSVQRGVSLVFVILIMSVILSVGLGVSAILIPQLRMSSEIGYSVVSLYAADSGVEEQLYYLYKVEPAQPVDSGSCGNASYSVEAKCCDPALPEDVCSLESCPAGFEIDLGCDAKNFCIKSIGTYQKTRRAIEVKY